MAIKRILLLSQHQIDFSLDLPHLEILTVNREQAFAADPQILSKSIKDFSPHLVLEREFNDSQTYLVSRQIVALCKELCPDCISATWLIDTHVILERHLAQAEFFDFAFLAIGRYLPDFEAKFPRRVFWLPLCYPSASQHIAPLQTLRKELDIIFIGAFGSGHPERTKYLEGLTKIYGDSFLALTTFENVAALIQKARVNFNCPAADEINFRIFETLAAGGTLVTKRVADLLNIQGLTERLALYDDFFACVEKIDAILEGSLSFDLKDNLEFIRSKHCMSHRIQSAVQMIENKQQQNF